MGALADDWDLLQTHTKDRARKESSDRAQHLLFQKWQRWPSKN